MFTLLDLFCGAGGMTAGFVDAGFVPIFAVDSCRWSVDTYNANFGHHATCTPVEDVEHFPKADVVIGGPPCQGFSNLGKRLPFDPRNQLWRHFVRAIAAAQPLYFVMENVPELLKSAEYEALKAETEGLGYEVDGQVLIAADYGIPQTRKRSFVIGSRVGPPLFPVPTHRRPDEVDLFNLHLPPWRTVRDAIADLPLVPTDFDWHIGRNPTTMSLERYRHVPEGGNRFDLPTHLQPPCWIRKTKGGTDLFGRLWWDRPAYTIRTEFFKPEKGRYLHPQADRPITHREAARFQTFSDDFTFCGSKIEVAKQIGNAVPSLLARRIAEAVREAVGDAQLTSASTQPTRAVCPTQ